MRKAIVSLFAFCISAVPVLPASAQSPGLRSQPPGQGAAVAVARSAVVAGVAHVSIKSSPNASASFSHLDIASRPLLELPFATRQAAAGAPLPTLPRTTA